MLLSLANELKVLPTDLNRLLIIVVVLSMALTPFLAEAGKRFADSTLPDDASKGEAPTCIRAANSMHVEDLPPKFRSSWHIARHTRVLTWLFLWYHMFNKQVLISESGVLFKSQAPDEYQMRCVQTAGILGRRQRARGRGCWTARR